MTISHHQAVTPQPQLMMPLLLEPQPQTKPLHHQLQLVPKMMMLNNQHQEPVVHHNSHHQANNHHKDQPLHHSVKIQMT